MHISTSKVGLYCIKEHTYNSHEFVRAKKLMLRDVDGAWAAADIVRLTLSAAQTPFQSKRVNVHVTSHSVQ